MSSWFEKIQLFVSAFKKELVPPMEQALNLLAENKIESFEDMEELAEQLGFDVEYVDGLPEKVSGFPGLDENGPYIGVSSDKDSTEKEITIGHEIGHHVLHDPMQSSPETPKQTRHADLFGCTLVLHGRNEMSNAEFKENYKDVAGLWWIAAITMLLMGKRPFLESNWPTSGRKRDSWSMTE